MLEPKLCVWVQRMNAVVHKQDAYADFFQSLGKRDGIQDIPGKSADFLW